LANTAGAILLAFVTWQLTLSPPSCCHQPAVHHGSNGSSHCHEIIKERLFSSADMHLTNSVVMLLAAFGLIVREINHLTSFTANFYSFLPLVMDKLMLFKVFL